MTSLAEQPATAPSWLRRRWWLVGGLLLLCVAPRLAWLGQLRGDDFDLGIYHNLAWNLSEGRGFWSDVLRRDHLGEHASPITALFAPLYALSPTAAWLVAAQGLAVAVVALVALWFAERRLAAVADPARRRLAWWAMLALVLGYAPLWAAWRHDPQPVVWGAAGLALALAAVEARRWWALWPALALLLASRESAALAGLGLAWWTWRAAGAPRAALAIAALSAAWGLAALLWLMPAMRDGAGWGHLDRLDPLADAPGKALYLARLLGQLALLPCLDPTAALAALPGALLNLCSGHAPQYGSAYHYDAQLAPFLLLAAAGGLARVAAGAPALPRPLAAAVLAGALAWGALPPLRGLAELADRPRAAAVALTRAEAARLLAQVPPDAPLAADPQLGPLVCLRRGYRTLRGPRDNGDPALVAALPPGTWILAQRWWWRTLPPPPGPLVVAEGDSVVLLRR